MQQQEREEREEAERRERVAREREAQEAKRRDGTQFTCCTGTKVRILTQEALQRRRRPRRPTRLPVLSLPLALLVQNYRY